MSIKGYKVFNPDWTCRDFQYEVGKTFEHEGNIEVCKEGFHFCQKMVNCFNYYPFDINNKVAEVEALGLVKQKRDKIVTDKIHIIRELTWNEVFDMCNFGINCKGIGNTDDFNVGTWNTGSRNIGHRNTGHCNIGDYNSDNYNCGSFNSGYHNIGNGNSGSYNCGNYNNGTWNNGNNNTGCWNKGDNLTGCFNTVQPFFVFNKPINISKEEFFNLPGIRILNQNHNNSWWIFSSEMTDEEKREHPEYEITGGYLKTIDFKTACKIMWEKFSEEDKQAVKEIPNFDANIFEEITGIDVNS